MDDEKKWRITNGRVDVGRRRSGAHILNSDPNVSTKFMSMRCQWNGLCCRQRCRCRHRHRLRRCRHHTCCHGVCVVSMNEQPVVVLTTDYERCREKGHIKPFASFYTTHLAAIITRYTVYTRCTCTLHGCCTTRTESNKKQQKQQQHRHNLRLESGKCGNGILHTM